MSVLSPSSELLQQLVWKEEELLSDHKLCNQESTSSPNQREPEPGRVKEEEPEPGRVKEEEPEPGRVKEEEPEPGGIKEEEPEPEGIKEEPSEFFVGREKEQLSPSQETLFQQKTKSEEAFGVSVVDDVHMEEETEGLLLETSEPQRSSHTAGIPQRVTEDGEALPHQPHHEEPELQITKENTELGTKQEEALVLKQEADTFTMTPVYEGREHNYSEPNHNQSHGSASVLQRRTTVSADDGQPNTCKTCGKRFSSSAMKRHMKTHAAGKPFSCNVCQKSFSQSSSLAAHVRRHTGEKPHSCKDCGKRFPQKSALTVHTRTHTGEKPHCCKECGTSFAQKCALVAHTRTHTGEKPYSCKVCQRSFRQSSSLADHVRTHAGGKGVLIIAKNLERSFTHKVALTVHTRAQTGQKPASSRGGI